MNYAEKLESIRLFTNPVLRRMTAEVSNNDLESWSKIRTFDSSKFIENRSEWKKEKKIRSLQMDREMDASFLFCYCWLLRKCGSSTWFPWFLLIRQSEIYLHKCSSTTLFTAISQGFHLAVSRSIQNNKLKHLDYAWQLWPHHKWF